ncbi:MAG: hypothetical protein KKA07_01000 [Bacteroidetes bacterium]|nr:hypothetical protein [Bacteroidota bacterium]MBU1717625.1 hypothetical protein [Bacteroidota bacterium]
MKKLARLYAEFLVLAMIFFVSCRHEPIPYPNMIISPVVLLNDGNGCVSRDTSLQTGEQFSVSVYAITDTVKNKKLTNFQITRENSSGTVVVLDSSINRPVFWGDIVLTAGANAGSEIWKFIFTDNAGETGEESFTLSLLNPPITLLWLSDSNLVTGTASIPVGTPYQTGIHAIADLAGGNYLTNLKITSLFQGNTTTLLDSALNDTQFDYLRSFTAKNQDGLEKIVFTVRDNEGRLASLNLFISSYTPLNQQFNGAVWNAMGTYHPAWDLVLNLPRQALDDEMQMDLFNTTTPPGLPPYHFENAWMSLNSTRFVKANFMDFSTSTYSDIIDVFSGATPSNISIFASSLSAGDVLIAEIRSQYEFFLLRIDDVHYTDSTNNNNDYIRFSYKKK